MGIKHPPGVALRIARHRMDLSARELVRLLNPVLHEEGGKSIKMPTIYAYETGRINIGKEVARALSRVLNVQYTALRPVAVPARILPPAPWYSPEFWDCKVNPFEIPEDYMHFDELLTCRSAERTGDRNMSNAKDWLAKWNYRRLTGNNLDTNM